ncbi:AAA family ATPase [Mucilaginibacter sp. AW1-7]|uniref:AAA family ATPase n=1 Tax=Mucilaginibacter sp. AW1-7 TaxID=3349874 RepID=UPI003F7379EE
MSKKRNIKPMYISYLEIENIKCFGKKQKLDLKSIDGTISPWTLILGNNGVGKTTLLKCVAWMDTAEETDKKKKNDAKIKGDKIAVKSSMDALESDTDYEQLARIGGEVISTVKAQMTIGTELGSIPKESDFLEYSISFKTNNGKLEEVTPTLTGVDEFHAPYIYGYSAGRHMELKNTERLELADPVGNLFSETGELFDAEDQLLNYDYTAIQEGPNAKEAIFLENIKTLLVSLLPGVESTKSIKTYAKTRTVKIKTTDGEVPLNNMSLGYKTMVAWIVDLALKMLAQNPDSKNPLEEPAIVIIDEIDLHLHPSWQRLIREKLTGTFKRTQFICTAHSPFMAQASEAENLCVLNRGENEVLIQNEPLIVKGWRLGQIVTSELFGLGSDRSPFAEKTIEQRRMLIDKNNLTANEKEQLNSLNDQIDSLPLEGGDEDDKIMQQIREAAKMLKEKGIIK